MNPPPKFRITWKSACVYTLKTPLLRLLRARTRTHIDRFAIEEGSDRIGVESYDKSENFPDSQDIIEAFSDYCAKYPEYDTVPEPLILHFVWPSQCVKQLAEKAKLDLESLSRELDRPILILITMTSFTVPILSLPGVPLASDNDQRILRASLQFENACGELYPKQRSPKQIDGRLEGRDGIGSGIHNPGDKILRENQSPKLKIPTTKYRTPLIMILIVVCIVAIAILAISVRTRTRYSPV